MAFAQSCTNFGMQEQMTAQYTQQGFTMCQSSMNGQEQQGMSPAFMPSTSGDNFMQSPNGLGFMPSPNGNNFMQSPNGPQFAQQGFTPTGQGFMPSPNGNNFMQSPNGLGFMPSPNGTNFALNTQTLPEQCFAAGFPTGQFSQQDMSPAGDVSEKVLNWLSQKALQKLEEVIAEDEDESDLEDCEEALEEERVYSPLLADLTPGSVGPVAEAVLRVHCAAGTADLALALVRRGVQDPAVAPAACANLLVVLTERLPLGHRRDAIAQPADLVATVVMRCHEYLSDVDTDDVHEHAHGAVLFLAELFKRKLVGMGEVKELFGRLVFSGDRPLDHAANLACHLFLTAGPFLETSATGRKLSDCMCARLRELKGINFSEATLFSLAHVTDLKLNKWVPKKESKPKKEKEEKKPESLRPESQDEKVLMIGRLFAEQRVAMAVVKELFSQLLFQDQVRESRVELACKLLRTVGPTLDASGPGKKLVEYVLLRLQEVSDSAAVRSVAGLRANGWTPLRSFTVSFAPSPQVACAC